MEELAVGLQGRCTQEKMAGTLKVPNYKTKKALAHSQTPPTDRNQGNLCGI
jgi:hypothetical protein